VIGHHRNTKQADPWAKPQLHAKFRADQSTGATCAREEEITQERKKGNDINLHWQTGSSPRPPTLRQRYVVLHAGWSSGGIVLSFKFRQNLMNRFRDVVVEICEWLI